MENQAKNEIKILEIIENIIIILTSFNFTFSWDKISSLKRIEKYRNNVENIILSWTYLSFWFLSDNIHKNFHLEFILILIIFDLFLLTKAQNFLWNLKSWIRHQMANPNNIWAIVTYNLSFEISILQTHSRSSICFECAQSFVKPEKMDNSFENLLHLFASSKIWVEEWK